MGSAHIITRVRVADGRWVADGQGVEGTSRRYVVRWRVGGRSSRLRHGGSFATKREAEARRKYLLDELAAGRIPDLRPSAPTMAPTVEQTIRAFIEARVDVAERTRQMYEWDLARLPAWIRALGVDELSAVILQDWIGEVVAAGKIGPASVKDSIGLLRAALRRAGVEPNPAERVTTPSYQPPEVRPPTAADLLKMVGAMSAEWRAIVCILEGSGMRVSEAARLLGRDVDRAGGRILVRRERTKRTGRVGSGERWIPLRPATLALIPEARHPDRPVLAFEPGTLREQIRTRTKALGLPRVTPHALRHRAASRWVAQGLPITVVRERLGHARASMTLDVYSHVLLEPGLDPALDLADLL